MGDSPRPLLVRVVLVREIHVQDVVLLIPEDNRILFFKRDRAAFGFLSNFHEAPIQIEGEVWRSTEFYYQAQKSHEAEYRDAIRAAPTPGHAKALGTDPRRSRAARKRSWFQGQVEAIRADWDAVKLQIMETAVRAKFLQHPDLQAMLLATLDAEIVEDSKHDSFWGIGRDGQGANWLGRLLMNLRHEIRAADHLGNDREMGSTILKRR